MRPWGAVASAAVVAASLTPAHASIGAEDRLVRSTRALAALAGFDVDPAAAIRRASLSASVAEPMAGIAEALLACARVTRAALDGAATVAEAAREPERFAAVRPCADRLWDATLALERALTGARLHETIDVWPVLRVESGDSDDFYAFDYMLQVDAGGNDAYMNNAGSNMIDLLNGPPGSPAPNHPPFAPGCRNALAGLFARECFPLAAVLLDLGGHDAYGVPQEPDPALDGKCTAEDVVRRQATAGQGFAGVGILRDTAGNDSYEGKTSSVGAGHIFGVGILSDPTGDDRYRVVRNGIGFALIGALGVVLDETGSDSYDFHIPAPLDPDAPNETPGAGGVIDDTGACDNRARFTAGAANLGGLGALVDLAGDDSYRGGYSDDYDAPFGRGRGGSVGFGWNGGTGLLLDGAGIDTYDVALEQGGPARGDGVTIPPGQESSGQFGTFVDR